MPTFHAFHWDKSKKGQNSQILLLKNERKRENIRRSQRKKAFFEAVEAWLIRWQYDLFHLLDPSAKKLSKISSKAQIKQGVKSAKKVGMFESFNLASKVSTFFSAQLLERSHVKNCKHEACEKFLRPMSLNLLEYFIQSAIIFCLLPLKDVESY